MIALIERDVAATRVGHAGVAQVATLGLIATAYDHYDSRAADPKLHTHVVIANEVQGEDGKWRSLDGRPMHQAVVAISEHYNAVLADRMTRALGVGWEQRERGRDRNPAWEIVGVPDELIAEFSSRSAAIDAETDRLIDTYTANHSHRPDTRTTLRLRQQATLSTRPDKAHHSSDLTDQWRRRADRVLGQDATSWAQHTLDTGSDPIRRAEDVSRDELAALGQAVVEQVQGKRSTWSRWNLHAEASRQTMDLRFASVIDREAVIGLVTDAAEAASLRLTSPELTIAPAAFTRPTRRACSGPVTRSSTRQPRCSRPRTGCSTSPEPRPDRRSTRSVPLRSRGPRMSKAGCCRPISAAWSSASQSRAGSWMC